MKNKHNNMVTVYDKKKDSTPIDTIYGIISYDTWLELQARHMRTHGRHVIVEHKAGRSRLLANRVSWSLKQWQRMKDRHGGVCIPTPTPI